jgi:hypothetical protein
VDHRDHSAHQAGADREARDPGQLPSPAGLIVADRDRSLLVSETLLPEGTTVPFSFRIEGPRGPLEDFDVLHDRRMHLIVVRRDLARFEHVHPTLRAGTWSVELGPLEPGVWRAFADFSTGGTPVTLGVDLHVAGHYRPERLPESSDGSRADGFDVRLSSSDERVLRFEVTRDGSAVDLERYLGARGHLLVLREGDLAFLHVHPIEEGLDFAVIYPSPGRYRLFLQFSVEGEVHLAAFIQGVPREPRD